MGNSYDHQGIHLRHRLEPTEEEDGSILRRKHPTRPSTPLGR